MSNIENYKFGEISFKCPNSWVVVINPDLGNNIPGFIVSLQKDLDEGSINLILGKIPDPNSSILSLKNTVNNFINNNGLELVNMEEILINDYIPALDYIIQEVPIKARYIVFNKNNTQYQLCFTTETQFDEVNKDIDIIINSLQIQKI